MDQIEHKYVEVNGLKLHVAEIGGGEEGPKAVLFCHGFPEIWYSWRHQMIAVAKAGYRAIAPDYRGYGLSDPPKEPEKACYTDFIGDLYSLLDVFGISKVCLVGKDFGARIVYLFALMYPERVAGVVTLGIPFLPPKLPSMLDGLPEGFYIARWQEPGKAEADFGRLHPKAVVRNIYVLFSRPEIPIAEENQEIMDLVDSSTPLPSWFTEEDLENYGALYEKSGFQTALKVPYRTMDEEFNISEVKVDAPALLIMGEKDYFIKFPNMEGYIRSDQAKMFVPKLETVFIPEGSHFVQEQLPDQMIKLAKEKIWYKSMSSTFSSHCPSLLPMMKSTKETFSTKEDLQKWSMDQIEHKYVEVNGLKLHVAEAGGRNGTGVVLFCHGFPEIWYSWRHQMVAVAKSGYRAIAPDYRGYGLSDPPKEPEKASYADFISDLYCLLDVFGISKVFLVGKSFGARIVYLFAMMYPDRVAGIVTLGIPFLPPKLPSMLEGIPEGVYIARWKELGKAEADFGRFSPKEVVRNIYVLFSRADIPIAEENQEIMDLVDSSTPLPSWFTEEDLEYYGALYEKSGFQTSLKVPYRSIDEGFEISEVEVDAPALLIMGEKDFYIKFSNLEGYIRSDQAKKFVPRLETVFIPEGSHFVQEQLPYQVNKLILNFLKTHF
ncbi:OLC1v1021589C1 [Oldenlandia corymbosa var. corymbosa]|uniref:OLC1v1021589C1 n=1 Tax=Oldenlandia corymbosa var. corymbosa TaxID=529605 RepID=A0AAV1BY96_OLDCO|nr:OLC1v1021589C1 [Oldenlandia corymbosa var. corymbosa]